MIKLYHYSNTDFKDRIDPSFFGANGYTGNSLRISEIKRSYFYLDQHSREFYLYGAKYCYIAEINPKKLYNLNTDSLNLAEQLKGKDIFLELKQRGYTGIIGNNGYPCACLFRAVKIKERKTLAKV